MPVYKILELQTSIREVGLTYTCNICGERLEPNSDWHVIQLKGGYQNGRSDFLGDMEEGEFVACARCLASWEKTWAHPMDRKFWMGPNPVSLVYNGEELLYLSGMLFRSRKEMEEYTWSPEEEEDPQNLREIKPGIYVNQNWSTACYEVLGHAYLGDEGLIIFRVVPGPLNMAFASNISEWSPQMVPV